MAKKNKAPRMLSAGWMANVGKSLGYSAMDRLGGKAPAMSSIATESKEIFMEAKDYVTELRKVKGLKNKSDKIFGRDTSEYISKAIKLKDNVFEDIRTGKLVNKERQDQAVNAAMGFSEDDFDIDFDFDSAFDDFDDDFDDTDEDGGSDKPTVVSPNINITSNISKDNPMVQAVEKHTEMTEMLANAEAERDIALTKAQLTLTTSAAKALSDNLGIVNENLGSIIAFNNTTMSQYTSSAIEYHKNSLATMNSILEELRKTSSANLNNTNKARKSIVSSGDVFGADGSFYLGAYIDLVKKNVKETAGSSTVGSMASMLFDSGGIDQIISTPLSFLADAMVNMIIPKAVDEIIETADGLIGAFLPSVVSKIGQYADSWDNPILQFLGNALGVKPTKTKVDLSQYNKGAIPFDGVTKKSIVEVIPTYLSKILAAVSNTEPIVFDYKTGKYSTVSKAKDDHFKEIRRRSLYEYDDLDLIENAVKAKEGLTDEERTELWNKIETGFVKLGRESGPLNFRSTDALDKIFNANVINPAIGENVIDEDTKKWLVSIFKSLPQKTQMNMFSGINKMASGEAESKLIRRLQEENPELLSLVYSGAYDKLQSAEEHARTLRASGPDERLEQVKEHLRAGRPIPEELKDVELDYEARNLKKEYEKNKGKFRLFKEDTKNPIAKFLGPIIEAPLNAVSKGIDKIGDKMLDIIFGKEEQLDEDGNPIRDEKLPLLTRIKNRFDKTKDWLHDKLFGDEGFFTKISNSAWYQNITSKFSTGFTKFMNFMFDGESGLLKGVTNTFSRYKDNTKDYFTRDGGVFNKLRDRKDSFMTGVRGFMNDVQGGPSATMDVTLDENGNIVSSNNMNRYTFMDRAKDEIRGGFQRFMDLFFGPKEFRDGTKNDNYVNLHEFANYAKENAPDAVANGIIGLGAGTVLSSASSGLLSSFILGPIGGAAVGFAGTFLAKSQTFQNLMFGYNDERTGDRIEGFISDKTQEWFSKNKGALLGGAGIGAIGGFMGLGALPGFLLGGPVSGAILGLGTALVAKSEAFQTLMFGELGEDGTTRTGGIIDKVKSKILNRPEIKNKELFGNIGAGTLGGLGLFTLVGLNPIIGATAGLASGIAISSEKWRTTIFGAEDENGKRSGGILGKLYITASEKFLKPLLITGAEAKTYLANWFDNEIAAPIVTAADYAFEGIKAAGHKLKDWFSETHFGNFINTNLFSPIKKLFGAVAHGFTSVTKMASKLILKMLSTPVKAISTIVKGASTYLIRGGLLSNIGKWIMDSPIGLPFKGISFIGKKMVQGLGLLTKGILTATKTVATIPFKLTNMLAKGLASGTKQVFSMLKDSNIGQSFIAGVIDPTRERIRAMQNPTMLALRDRERDRREARNQRKADREAALEDFKNRLSNTDITSKFGNARDAAKAMKSKYGKEYGNLSQLEKARINTEEKQAQDIHDIKEILKVKLEKPITHTVSQDDVDNMYNYNPGYRDTASNGWNTNSTKWKPGSASMTLGPDGKPKPDNSSIIGPDGKVDQRQLDPETNPNVAEASAGIASGLTNALTSSDSPLASFGDIMGTIGAVFSPFKKYIAIGGLVALGVISLFSNPVKFFTGVINTLVDTLGVLLDPLFRWLDKQGYSRGYQNEYDLDTANELNKILEKNPDAINDVELAKSAVKLYKSTVKQNDKYDKMNVFEKGLTNVMGGYGIYRDKREKKKINFEESEARKAEALGILKFIDSGMSAESLGLTDKDIEQLRKDAAFEASASDIANSTIVSVQNSWLSPEMLGSKLYKFAAQKIGGPTTQNDDVTNALNEYKSEPATSEGGSGAGKSRAVGEPNVPENDTYKLHAGEGVLTASANHLFGGSETTAGLLNAYARTHSMSSDKSALSTILGTVGGSLTTNPNIENAMYGDSTDTKDLEKYLTKVRNESLSIDDSKYWKFDETSGGKYGGIAKSLFKIVRFANYPTRLINNTLGNVADDMSDIELDITGISSTGATNSSKSLGSKISSSVKNTFSSVTGWFSNLFDGIGNAFSQPTQSTSPSSNNTQSSNTSSKKSVMSTLTTGISNVSSKISGWVSGLFGGNGGGYETPRSSQKITLGMSSSDYYKFPSSSITSSDISPSRTIDGMGTKAHKGLDLLVQNRSDLSIRSMTNGTVVHAGYSNSYGNMVQIEDENGMYHLYAHMKSLKVKEGDKVQIGTVIGIEGTTGRSTGNHLHYEVGTGFNKGGSLTGRVHPAEYMQGYNSGGTIHATPIEDYVVGSFWEGKSGAKAQPITNVSSGTSTASTNQYAGKSILDILYSPVAGFNNALKSLFAPKNANTTETGGTYFATSGTTGLATGNTDPERIWNYLISAGISPNGAAGIMGNLRAESGLRSNNLQDSYEYLGSDTEYTNKVDNGSYANFSKDRAGYGLAQWTDGGRKANLLKAAKSAGTSISDINMQMDFLMSELGTNYPNLLSLAQSKSSSIKDVSDEMLFDFERPKNAASKSNQRAKYGEEIYRQFTGGLGGSDDYTKDRFTTSHMTPSAQAARVNTNILVVLNKVLNVLNQINGNTSKATDTLTDIRNNTRNQSTTETPTKPVIKSKQPNTSMYDIASNRKNELSKKNYSIAKSIAKGM